MHNLENIRQQSLKTWADAQRRALHEAVRNNPVNQYQAAAAGTGSGGTASDSPLDIFYSVYKQDSVFHYRQFSLETKQWSDPFSFDVNSSIYIEYVFRTNGYGLGLEFQNDDGGSDTILSYVNSKGQLAWTSGPVEWADYDVDTEPSVGLVSFFMDNNGSFEIKTFYKDIENTFTFDNYLGNTSHNLNNGLYGSKAVYRFGNFFDGNLALYALDLLSGSKTLLYTPAAGNTVEVYMPTYDDAVYENTINCLDRLIVIEVNDETGNIADLKIIDFNGKVIQNIKSQFLSLGYDITQISYWSSYFTIFGKYEITRSQDDVFMFFRYQANNANTVIYFGAKDGAIWYDSELSENLTTFTPFNGNSLVMVYPTDIIQNAGNMIVGNGALLDVIVASPSNTLVTSLESLTTDMVMFGNNLYTFTTGEGGLFLLTWNLQTNIQDFEPVAIGQAYNPLNNVDTFNVFSCISLGNLEYYCDADSDDSGSWTVVYKNSKSQGAYDLLSNTSTSSSFYNFGGNLPTLIQNSGYDFTYRVDQATNDLTEVYEGANYINGGNGSTWKRDVTKWIVGNSSSGVAKLVDANEIITLYLPQEGVNLAGSSLGPDKIILRGSDDLFYFYTSDGNFLTLASVFGANWGLWSDILYWESNGEASVYDGENTYTQTLGDVIDRFDINDNWF